MKSMVDDFSKFTDLMQKIKSGEEDGENWTYSYDGRLVFLHKLDDEMEIADDSIIMIDAIKHINDVVEFFIKDLGILIIE